MCKLLDLAKEKQQTSYYGIAKIVGISTPVLNKWIHNKSKPNGLHTLKLAELAGLSTKEAIKIVEGGFIEVSLLIVTSLAGMALLALTSVRQLCILCKIRRVNAVGCHWYSEKPANAI